MMVTFVSQCEKNALHKTRRVLDAFANRIGDKTWQAIITNEGLNAVKKLLRKTASKNTAVSCHWLRSRSRSELVWIVGDRQKFNAQGIVPVNSTMQSIVNTHWENDWYYLPVIKSLAALAALFHDFGKACVCFQEKLEPDSKNKFKGDPLRHEWVSVLLFNAFVNGKTDEEWLKQLAQGELNEALLTSITAKNTKKPLEGLSPAASLIAWLIVSHHKLPLIDDDIKHESATTFSILLARISQQWGYENSWDEADFTKRFAQCLTFANGLPSQSPPWLKPVMKWAQKMHDCLPLLTQALADGGWRLILHHARLSLMLGDHHYSSQKADEKWRSILTLYANTDRKTKQLKQKLDEHLVGVANAALQVAHLLPAFETEPERAYDIKALKKKSPPSFAWQDKAVEQIKCWKQGLPAGQTNSAYGFFAVNLASTGCGKTHANAKVMRALSPDSISLRFILALGLRTLTLQTGDEYRERVGLDESELAILIGARAVMELHQKKDAVQQEQGELISYEAAGSESLETLLEDGDISYECIIPEDKLNTVLKDQRDRKFLYAPVLVCTIDHIIPATECRRGGRYILPSLRLMSSDLVIDEIDDFDGKDLIAIGRLIHLAGMLGRKVMISSATLPPDLVEGYFNAYREGWLLFAKTRQLSSKIGCAWIDEFNTKVETLAEAETAKAISDYKGHHQRFIEKRIEKLQRQPIKRKAEIILCQEVKQEIINKHCDDNTLKSEQTIELLYFQAMQQAIIAKHQQHASLDPVTQKPVSFGVVRMANINPCVALTQYLAKTDWPDNIDIRVMAYHSQQVLLLRHAQEQHLDAVLKRPLKQGEAPKIFNNPIIRKHLDASSGQQMIFIVVATPVEEVGRDHDFDWAVVEPSSLRSIIQLAGRVLRHRDSEPKQPNIALMQYNLRALKNGDNGKIAYCRPGYEREWGEYRLKSHDLAQLLESRFLAAINAIPRIRRLPELRSTENLADLEHYAIAKLLTAYQEVGANQLQGWLTQCWWLTGLPQYCAPFRQSNEEQHLTVYWVPEGDDCKFCLKDDSGKLVPCEQRYFETLTLDPQTLSKFWMCDASSYRQLLADRAKEQGITLREAAGRYGEVAVAYHEDNQRYQYSPYLGLSRYRGD